MRDAPTAVQAWTAAAPALVPAHEGAAQERGEPSGVAIAVGQIVADEGSAARFGAGFGVGFAI